MLVYSGYFDFNNPELAHLVAQQEGKSDNLEPQPSHYPVTQDITPLGPKQANNLALTHALKQIQATHQRAAYKPRARINLATTKAISAKALPVEIARQKTLIQTSPLDTKTSISPQRLILNRIMALTGFIALNTITYVVIHQLANI